MATTPTTRREPGYSRLDRFGHPRAGRPGGSDAPICVSSGFESFAVAVGEVVVRASAEFEFANT